MPLQVQGGDTAGLEVHSSTRRGERQRQGNVRSAQDSFFIVVQFYKLKFRDISLYWLHNIGHRELDLRSITT